MRTHEARSYPCALMQSLPPVSRVAPLAGLSPSVYDKGIARDLYNIGIRITHIDHLIIRGYYLHEYHFASTTGRAQKQMPSPGLRRQRMPGSTLPSGVRTQALPTELEHKLSALPAGFERVLVDHDVLLVEAATREIVDVMRNVRTTGGPEGHAARERNRTPTSISLPGGARQDPAARWRLYERVAIL